VLCKSSLRISMKGQYIHDCIIELERGGGWVLKPELVLLRSCLELVQDIHIIVEVSSTPMCEQSMY